MGNLVTIPAVGPAGKRHTRQVDEAQTERDERDSLLAYAFRALGNRALTEAELRARLERRSKNAELIQEVLGRVQELGYQDDALVAQVEGGRRSVGALRIRHTLKRRGLDQELIQQTLAARDPDAELEAVRELLSRRWASFARKRDPKASAYAFLARRGFAASAIWTALREVAEMDDSEEYSEE